MARFLAHVNVGVHVIRQTSVTTIIDCNNGDTPYHSGWGIHCIIAHGL